MEFLTGQQIYLRALKEEDINEQYLSWINDPEVTQFMEVGRFPTTLMELREYYQGITKSKNDVLFAIVVKKINQHIGNIKLGRIDWIHRFADLGIMIGEKICWGRGYGQEACALVVRYAFERLNLNKVILGVYANHITAIKAYENIGFEKEGRIRDVYYYQGQYVDKVIMSVSRSTVTHDYQKISQEAEANLNG